MAVAGLLIMMEADMETVNEVEKEIDTGEGGGADADGLLRGTYDGRIHLAGGGTNPQEGRILLWYLPGGGGVEGGYGHHQFLSYQLH